MLPFHGTSMYCRFAALQSISFTLLFVSNSRNEANELRLQLMMAFYMLLRYAMATGEIFSGVKCLFLENQSKVFLSF